MISFDMFLQEFFSAIKADTPAVEEVNAKGYEALLLHDLELDFDLLEDIMIDLVRQLNANPKNALTIFNIDPIASYLPQSVGLIDRFFHRIEKKYFPKFEPLSIRRAAELIYEKSKKGSE